jgi:hypothetical protein
MNRLSGSAPLSGAGTRRQLRGIGIDDLRSADLCLAPYRRRRHRAVDPFVQLLRFFGLQAVAERPASASPRRPSRMTFSGFRLAQAFEVLGQQRRTDPAQPRRAMAGGTVLAVERLLTSLPDVGVARVAARRTRAMLACRFIMLS